MQLINNNRIYWLDALRGIAVILMIQQHLGFWLWDAKGSMLTLFHSHPLMVSINGLGGLAAPLFILLAGTGSALFIYSYNKPVRQLYVRGMSIVLAGYLLNICVPSWFSPGSWYVLHLIGFCIALTPLLIHLSTKRLFFMAGLAIVIALILQTLFQTPRFMGNQRMSDYSLSGGIFRLAFAEGHFPVFPWLAMYLWGFIAGKWYINNNIKSIKRLGFVLLAICAFLSVGYVIVYPLIKFDFFARLFRFVPVFYPALAPIFIFLSACAIFLFLIMFLIDKKKNFLPENPLVHLGRVSLTLLIAHAFLFKQLSISLGFWKTFSPLATALVIVVVILACAYGAKLWSKVEYIFSLEWLVRKISTRIVKQSE